MKLKISGDSLDHVEIAETLLEEAGVLDLLPTDELRVLDYLGLRQLSFDFGDEPAFAKTDPRIRAHLRAALSVNDRVVATHSELGQKQRRWSVFHEIAHFVLPEHIEKIFLLDTDQTLSPWTKVRLEREANGLAAELMFQGNRFTERSLDLPLSCRTVIELAPQFDASYESAMRRYVERHILPCAVIVYDKVPGTFGEDEDAKYRIQYTVTSTPFKRKYFAGVKTTTDLTRGSDIFQVHGSWNIGNIVETELIVERNEEPPWRFQSEIFTNGYKIFQFIIRPVE